MAIVIGVVDTNRARLVGASCGKRKQTHAQCNWSRQSFQAWLANDGRVEDVEGVFVRMNVDGLVLSAITRGAFDLL